MKRSLALNLCVLLVSTVALAQGPAIAADNPVVATVNGDPVYTAALRIAMQNLNAQQVQSGNEQPDPSKLNRLALQQIIDRKLLAQEATRREISADDNLVKQAMDQIVQQAGSREALETSLNQLGMSDEQLTTEVTESLIVQQLVVDKLQPGISVSDEQVKAYYDSNPDQFTVPPQVRARHILLKVEPGATDEQRQQARAAAEKAHERAVAGEDFATLAKELSQCPSAQDGGDLGFFSAERMVKPFADVALALEPGQISDVVTTQFGYHVIKAEEKRPASKKPFTEVEQQIRQGLVHQATGEAVEQLLVKLRADAEIVLPEGIPGAGPTQK